jgi:DNA-binding transcriptional LysR family regulator
MLAPGMLPGHSIDSAMQRLIHPSVRAFVALAENGTLAGAGDAVGRTASAVSLQITALEGRLGRQLFTRGARGMQLSPAGHVLLRHARALLAAEAKAEAELRTAELSGEVRFGMPQDFASSQLALTLNRFRRTHPGVKVTAVIERNGVIASLARRSELDLAVLIAWRAPARALASARRCSHWFACGDLRWERSRPLPLVLLDSPCIYRDHALRALEREGIAWEVAFSTASVTAMWAAVAAGLGVTVRMDLGAPRSVRRIDAAFGLPRLPETVLSLVGPAPAGSACAAALAALVQDSLGRMTAAGRQPRRVPVEDQA